MNISKELVKISIILESFISMIKANTLIIKRKIKNIIFNIEGTFYKVLGKILIKKTTNIYKKLILVIIILYTLIYFLVD